MTNQTNKPTKGRRGYTKEGYPIVWKKRFTHEECMDFLARGVKPPKSEGTKRVRALDTGNMVSVLRKTTADFTFEFEGIPVEITVDTRQFGVKVNNHHTYFETAKRMLMSVREQLLRAGLKKDSDAISDLGDIISLEKRITESMMADFPAVALQAARETATTSE